MQRGRWAGKLKSARCNRVVARILRFGMLIDRRKFSTALATIPACRFIEMASGLVNPAIPHVTHCWN